VQQVPRQPRADGFDRPDADRDGARFGAILDFLCDLDGPRMQRAMRALPEAAQEALVQELDYFGLEAAVFGERPWTDGAFFRPGPEMRDDRRHCTAVAAGGRVFVFGGSGDKTTEVLDAQTMAFSNGPRVLTSRMGGAAVQFDADRVLLAGGHDDRYLDTTEIFRLSTLTFSQGPKMRSARGCCAAVALDARRILVVGGDDGESYETYLSSTEILSLDTTAFAPGPDMAAPRGGCAAVVMDEHRVLVAGGTSGSGHVFGYDGDPRLPDHGLRARAADGLGAPVLRDRDGRRAARPRHRRAGLGVQHIGLNGAPRRGDAGVCGGAGAAGRAVRVRLRVRGTPRRRGRPRDRPRERLGDRGAGRRRRRLNGARPRPVRTFQGDRPRTMPRAAKELDAPPARAALPTPTTAAEDDHDRPPSTIPTTTIPTTSY
jgi:hypothetical protein